MAIRLNHKTATNSCFLQSHKRVKITCGHCCTPALIDDLNSSISHFYVIWLVAFDVRGWLIVSL